jgi:YVTN family beta-propeller protein
MPRSTPRRLAFPLAIILAAAVPSTAPGADDATHRSPYALAVRPDGTRLLSANHTAGSVSLIDPVAGGVLHELKTGDRPSGVAFTPDGARAIVAHWAGYDVALLGVADDRLTLLGRVEVGPEPRGVAISADGKTAYVAVGVANEVVRVDLDPGGLKVTGRLPVGREPRGLALSSDGTHLLATCARAQAIDLIDVPAWKVERSLPVRVENLRQVAFGPDGMAYSVGMENRGFATTSSNIDAGWVLGQRVVRVPVDGSEAFESLSLDPHSRAVSDVHGLAFSPDGTTLAVSAGGTREVLLFRLDNGRLPWRRNGFRDLMAPDLVTDASRFQRVPTDGRPTELAFAPDGKTLYVANYLGDSIQAIDTAKVEVVRSIALGPEIELTPERRGEWIFHDGRRSLNQWYSCNTCHSDGHTNGADYDTMNDGWHDFTSAHTRSRKKAPTLRRVAETGPWTWHGWQTSFEQAMDESFTKSMQGREPSRADVNDLIAFLKTLDYPKNPNRNPDGSLTEAAQRGELVFRSAKAACSSCHGGPEFTNGRIHDVGLNERGDVYRGHNPPSLRGVYDKDPYLHDGRAKTLRDALTKDHSAELVTGLGSLTPSELDDLIAYLRSL